MRIRLTAMVLALCLALGSCIKDYDDPQEDEQLSCTMLVYMVAENSLNPYTARNINDMIQAAPGLKSNERIMIYIDDLQLPRIYIIDNKTKGVFSSDPNICIDYAKKYTEDFNSSDPKTLERVIEDMQILCPSREYAYVFWSHGSGWIPSKSHDDKLMPTRTFGVDNQHNNMNNDGFQMNMDQLAQTLAKFGRSRFIMFDACFMQTFEAAYELRDVTDYIIGSPAEIPGYGAPYGVQLKHFFATPFNPDSVAFDYWDWYVQNSDMGVAISVINTSQLDQLAATTRQLIDINALADINPNGINNYFKYDQWRGMAQYPDAFDARSIMEAVLSEQDYETWMQSFRLAVPYTYATTTWYSIYNNGYNRINLDTYGGVSMYVPRTVYKNRGEYFYDAYPLTKWGQFLINRDSQ